MSIIHLDYGFMVLGPVVEVTICHKYPPLVGDLSYSQNNRTVSPHRIHNKVKHSLKFKVKLTLKSCGSHKNV